MGGRKGIPYSYEGLRAWHRSHERLHSSRPAHVIGKQSAGNSRLWGPAQALGAPSPPPGPTSASVGRNATERDRNVHGLVTSLPRTRLAVRMCGDGQAYTLYHPPWPSCPCGPTPTPASDHIFAAVWRSLRGRYLRLVWIIAHLSYSTSLGRAHLAIGWTRERPEFTDKMRSDVPCHCSLPPVPIVHEPSQAIPDEERKQATAHLERSRQRVSQVLLHLHSRSVWPSREDMGYAKRSITKPRTRPLTELHRKRPEELNRNNPPLTCVAISTLVRLSSRIGPSRSKNTFRIVKFVVDSISPVFTSTVSSTRPRAENKRSTSVASLVGRLSLNSAFEG